MTIEEGNALIAKFVGIKMKADKKTYELPAEYQQVLKLKTTQFLNFNENFEFNSVGVEGCITQLMQIVYTATDFSTVKSVQFLVEGEKKEYLGTEGQWIGSPLSRNNF